MEEYFGAYLVCVAALLHVLNYSKFPLMHKQIFHRLESLRSGSFQDFKTVSFFFLVILVTNFDVMF